jgi:pyruvate,water dikinase
MSIRCSSRCSTTQSFVPIIEKRRGEKDRKIIYDSGPKEPTRLVPTSLAERAGFVLTDSEIVRLAHWAVLIERHYKTAVDVEWAKDGRNGQIYIVQARPETVQSRRQPGVLRSYKMIRKGERLLTGLSIGSAIVAGRVCLIRTPDEIDRFQDDAILVAESTDPDWVPIMRRAAAIVTDHGGRTSHAAIVSQELGLPAIVGTGAATHLLHDGQEITVTCALAEVGFRAIRENAAMSLRVILRRSLHIGCRIRSSAVSGSVPALLPGSEFEAARRRRVWNRRFTIARALYEPLRRLV